jgi:hypothetical protein
MVCKFFESVKSSFNKQIHLSGNRVNQDLGRFVAATLQFCGSTPSSSSIVALNSRIDTLRTDEIAPRMIEAEARPKKVKHRRALSAAAAIMFSFFAGASVQRGLERFLSNKGNYEWVYNVLWGLGLLVMSIVYIMQRKVKATEATDSPESTSR